MKTDLVISTLCKLTRPLMLRSGWRTDCCIATTRALTRVFSSYGIQSHALMVELVIWNNAMREKVNAVGRVAETHEEMREWFKECGAWTMGLGIPDPAAPDSWHGHMVVVIENRVILDASIDQADRPARGVKFPYSITAEVDDTFLSGEEPRICISPTGMLLRYQARPNDQRYVDSPDWEQQYRTDRVVHQLCAVIDTDLFMQGGQ